MGQKKDFRYYLTIFGIASLGIVIFTGVNWISAGSLDNTLVIMALILPISFTVFLFLFDKLLELIIPKKLKQKRELTGFEQFAAKTNKVIEEQCGFSIEDYRKLQTNEKFQKTLRQVYKIMEDGETRDLTYAYLQKKFKKDTREFEALNIFISEAKKMKQNS